MDFPILDHTILCDIPEKFGQDILGGVGLRKEVVLIRADTFWYESALPQNCPHHILCQEYLICRPFQKSIIIYNNNNNNNNNNKNNNNNNENSCLFIRRQFRYNCTIIPS